MVQRFAERDLFGWIGWQAVAGTLVAMAGVALLFLS